MRHTDIAIIGGGLAGATLAAMLGRAGTPALMIDPEPVYPPDFRCEKLDTSQLRLLEKTGLADTVLKSAASIRELWIARHGCVIYKRRNEQYGIAYAPLVNAMRARIGGSAQSLVAKAAAITPGDDRQIVTLSGGEEISARLVVLASGLGNGLRQSLGIEREDIGRAHSISVGFDMRAPARGGFAFPALTYFGEQAGDRVAYLTVFPMGSVMRANLFVYHDLRDPWLSRMRETPREALFALQPGLRPLLGDFEVAGNVQLRPADLYRTRSYRRPGIVLAGDAFATSCPAVGSGLSKVFTDALQLATVHIPRWLETPGMAAGKIAQFYDDPVKVGADEQSEARAFYMRSLSTQTRLSWRARRWGKFIGQWSVGVVQRMPRFPVSSPVGSGAPAENIMAS